MTIYAAILLLSATGSATRTMEVQDSIAGVVGQVILGGVRDVVGSVDRNKSTGSLARIAGISETLSLRIDGTERAGWRAWAEAGWRVAGYALDRRRDGSVEYGYRLLVRGYVIERSTAISDGNVLLTTSTGWTERVSITKKITREVPIHVSIEIRATERGTQTLLVGAASGHALLSEFRCGIVRRIAEQRAAAELDSGLADALLRIQRGGTELYRHGASDVLDALDAIDIGSRR